MVNRNCRLGFPAVHQSDVIPNEWRNAVSQPNKGSAGTPHISTPIMNTSRPKPSTPADSGIKFGAPGGKGTKGSK